jgi:hypothetical protein
VLEQIEVRECLLSFGAGSFVFQCAIQKYKDYDIQNYNFASGFVWVLLTMREKCRLRMFENRVLRRIFGPKKDDVIG